MPHLLVNPRLAPLALALALVALAACGADDTPAPTFDVVVRVSGDPGQPVGGAQILLGGAKVGATSAAGVAKLRVRGEEGEQVELGVACPAGFRSPPRPLVVGLRRLSDPTKLPEYEATCLPSTRTVVVVVRAEGGPNLPVLYLGREVARTDASGAAHVVLDKAGGESFELMLGTGEKGAEALRPKNPVVTFNVRARDDLYVFDQRFTSEVRRVWKATGPTRL